MRETEAGRVRVEDVAQVTRRYAEPDSFIRFNGQKTLMLSVEMQNGFNIVEFGQKSQFVVITHNKKTVSGARTLLGVTMQESGVSRLITMRLDGQEKSDEEPVKAGR